MNRYKLSDKLLTLNNKQFVLLDAIVFALTPFLSLVLRLDDFAIFSRYRYGLIIATLGFLAIKFSVFASFNFYKRYWRYASVEEVLELTLLIVVAALAEMIILIVATHFSGVYLVPLSLPLLDGILSLLLVGGIRFSVRAVDRSRQQKKHHYRKDRALVVGAGDSGVSIVKEMQRNPKLGFAPVAFIDDNASKLGMTIAGISVVGDRFAIPEMVASRNIRQVVIAMPSASGKVIREIVDMCQAIGVNTVTVPGLNEILDRQASINTVREVKIEDLLRRAPIQTDTHKVLNFIQGKTVLVTGGGGSIGSELCRQIFRCRPQKIILVGHGENSIFNIQQELRQVVQILHQEGNEQHQPPEIISFIADLRFKSRLEAAFVGYQPEIVFHAAAHKHVPLMEENPPEAITNNVLGTKNLLDLAIEYDVKHFVMVSTDKAVNPTNVMGASKRTAEMLVLQAAKKTGKPYVVVRFGNVLGSRGSVVPTFRKQIAKGGPVTITHPEITRYFMTIPEAVQLVLQASVLSKADQIFMLNMGEPVKILDLAKDLIRLSGYEVGKDIEIIFTGLRPGEKLHEELLIAGEAYDPTPHDKLLVVKDASSIIPHNFDLIVNVLVKAAKNNDVNLILFLLDRLITGYKPKDIAIDSEKAQDCLEAIISRVCGIDSSLSNNAIIKGDSGLGSLEMFATSEIDPENLDREIRLGIENEEFCLYYQPVVDLKTEEVRSLEALLRWRHPQLGIIAPSRFIAVAEESGLIMPLQRWIIERVCSQLQTWYRETGLRSSVSINLHSRHLLSGDLVKHIQYNLNKYQIQPKQLKLDIAEHLIRENPYSAMTMIPQLKALGVCLQLDNFGRVNNYDSQLASNLLYQQFDGIKLDRYLIDRIDKDRDGLALFQSMTARIVDSGLKIVAVGIETKAQLQEVKTTAIDYGQGYFLRQPLATRSIPSLIGQPLNGNN